MPERAKQHIVADQATTAVAALLAEAGHAVERVLNDYGEDLLVQTSHAGQMDASRLWFQVKGTQDIAGHRRKGGGLQISVSKDHAIRWVRSTDLVVIVLWDVVGGTGWFALPRQQIDHWNQVSTARITTTIHFADSDQLTLRAAKRLAWESRIDHYRYLILSARDIDAEAEEDGRASSRWVLVALEFINLLGITERRWKEADEHRIRAEFRDTFKRYLEQALEKDDDLEKATDAAAVLTILYSLSEIDLELYLPGSLIEDGAEVLIALLGIRTPVEEARP